VAVPASTSAERIIEKAPEFADKIMAFINEKTSPDQEEQA